MARGGGVIGFHNSAGSTPSLWQLASASATRARRSKFARCKVAIWLSRSVSRSATATRSRRDISSLRVLMRSAVSRIMLFSPYRSSVLRWTCVRWLTAKGLTETLPGGMAASASLKSSQTSSRTLSSSRGRGISLGRAAEIWTRFLRMDAPPSSRAPSRQQAQRVHPPASPRLPLPNVQKDQLRREPAVA